MSCVCECSARRTLSSWHYGQFDKYLLSTHSLHGTVSSVGEIAMNKPEETGEAYVEIDIKNKMGQRE